MTKLPRRLTLLAPRLRLVLTALVVAAGLLCSAAPASAATTATFINPTSGATNVDTTQPFTWTSVPGAQTYYLYVGTTQGGKDLVNTGETQATSYTVPPLPSGQTLWARIWTEQNNVWTYQDVSFTALPRVATFTNPTNGATNVDTSKPFTWTSITGVQAYYLYVGTSQGAKDLVNTGETQATSYTVPPLPTGQTLWARIWTETAGYWRYQDVSFTAAQTVSRPIYPTNGQTNVDPATPFSWYATPTAQAYHLYVGTTQGGSDLVDSGDISTNSYQVPPLPTGQTLWERIGTKINGTWQYQDASFTAAQPSRAILSNPRNGQTNVDPAIPFTWYPSPNAQAYELYVGTSQGAKDILDSFQTQATSYQIRTALPTGQPLWARLYTETNNVWKYMDVSFTATTPSRAVFTAPTNGQTNVKSPTFSWTSIAGAQSYYLYVGTSQGAKDVADTGEIQGTSYTVSGLPIGRTLWGRIWTHTASGAWLYSDVSFVVSEGTAQLTYPTQGATGVDTRHPFTWSTTPDGQAYSLWLGSTPGARDLGGSNATTGTSWNPPSLPIGQTVYARLYTEHNGSWDTYVDSTFTVAYSYASLSYPSQNDPNVDQTLPFSWQPISGSTAYYVWIGSSQGASDVAQSGQITSTSWSPGQLPVGSHLWARLWTLASGAWVYGSDVQFSPGPMITAPAQQSVTVDRTQPITWVPGAVLNGQQPTYELMVGSKPGANDLYDSGTISSTSVTVPAAAMPAGKALYARVIYHLGDGTQRRTDVVFATSDSTVAPSQMNWGTNGSSNVDASQPFQWNGQDLAQGYDLQILDSSSNKVADSGTIGVPEYFDETLAPGTYTARLGTLLGGTWSWTTSAFTVSTGGTSATNEIAAAHWATDYVRHMADSQNYAYEWTDLAHVLATWQPLVQAQCGHYASELVNVLKQMNVAGQRTAAQQPQTFVTYLDFNAGDGHVAVKFWNADDQDWIVLDPTFDIAMKRASDGHWATADDAHAATVAKNWSAISYVALGDYGTSIPHGYYIDYPLLYLNPTGQSPEINPEPYMTALSSPPTNNWNIYTVTSNQNPVTILVDGNPYQPIFQSPSGVSTAFSASTISLPSGSTASITVWALNRYVFPFGS